MKYCISSMVLILLLLLTRCSDEELDTMPPTAVILQPADQAMVEVPGTLDVQSQLDDDFNLSNYTIYIKNDFQSYIYRSINGTIINYDENYVTSGSSKIVTQSVSLPEVSSGPYEIWIEVKDQFEAVGYSDTVKVWLTNDGQSTIDVSNLTSEGKLMATKGEGLELDGFIGDPISLSGDGGFHDFKVFLAGEEAGILHSKVIDIGDPAILISLGDFVDHPDYGGGIDIPESLTDTSLKLAIFVIDEQYNLTYREIEVIVQ